MAKDPLSLNMERLDINRGIVLNYRPALVEPERWHAWASTVLYGPQEGFGATAKDALEQLSVILCDIG
jgi:hypothetical protein